MTAGPIVPPAVVAFIGLGQMGKPMAARLIGAGYRLRVYDASQQAVSDFVGAHPGAIATASAKAAAAGADAVVTMLPEGKVVRRAVLEGADAAAEGMSKEALLIDMSSSSPVDTVATGETMKKRGLRMIDAPVSGGVPRAKDGSLAIMAGGDADEIDRAQHLFLAMGKSLHRTGALGSGHAMKALNNFLSASSLAAMCEALLVGQAFGLDPTTMVDVFNSSSGMSNSTQLKGKQHIISGTFSAGFTMGLMAKDLGTAAGIAEHLKLSTPMLADQANLWREAVGELGPAADHTAIYKHQAKKAGAAKAG